MARNRRDRCRRVGIGRSGGGTGGHLTGRADECGKFSSLVGLLFFGRRPLGQIAFSLFVFYLSTLISSSSPWGHHQCPLPTLSAKRINQATHPSPPRGIATHPGVHPTGRRLLFFLSTMVFGALSAMLYGGHPTLSIGTVLHKVDVRTVFFGTICLIVLLVLGAFLYLLLLRRKV